MTMDCPLVHAMPQSFWEALHCGAHGGVLIYGVQLLARKRWENGKCYMYPLPPVGVCVARGFHTEVLGTLTQPAERCYHFGLLEDGEAGGSCTLPS